MYVNIFTSYNTTSDFNVCIEDKSNSIYHRSRVCGRTPPKQLEYNDFFCVFSRYENRYEYYIAK